MLIFNYNQRSLSLVFLLLPVLYWGALDHPSSSPRWALLSVALPILWLYCKPQWRNVHWLGVIFMLSVYATLSFEQSWRFTILALAFILGTSLERIKPVVWAFFIGIILNIPFLIFQLFGWEGLLRADDPGGFFFNGTFLADAAALAAISLSPLLPLPLTVLALLTALSVSLAAGGKGAIVALGMCGIVAIPNKPAKIVLAVTGLLLFTAFIVLSGSNSIEVRIPLWVNSLLLIDFFGRDFWALYPTVHDAILPTDPGIFDSYVRPRTAHNDILTVAVEFGIIGIVSLSALVVGIITGPKKTREDWSAYYGVLAFVFLGLFNFPLFTPTSAFAALLLGYLSRNSVLVFPDPRRIFIRSGK